MQCQIFEVYRLSPLMTADERPRCSPKCLISGMPFTAAPFGGYASLPHHRGSRFQACRAGPFPACLPQENAMDQDYFSCELDYYNHRLPTPDWCIEKAVIPFTDITYVVDGEARYSVNGRSFNVSSGDLICVPAGSVRSAHTYPGREIESECLNIYLRYLDGSPFPAPFPLLTHIGPADDVMPILRRINENWLMREPGYKTRIQSYILRVIDLYRQHVEGYDPSLQQDQRIRTAMRYIANHYMENLQVADIAETVNLNPAYFGSLFKKQTGISVNAYITSIRLNHAEDLLLLGKSNVSQVAQACGFSDVYYFSRTYKKFKGIAPSQVSRRTHRNI